MTIHGYGALETEQDEALASVCAETNQNSETFVADAGLSVTILLCIHPTCERQNSVCMSL